MTNKIFWLSLYHARRNTWSLPYTKHDILYGLGLFYYLLIIGIGNFIFYFELQMKNIIKIGVLSLALISSIVLLSKTNAQVSDTGDVSLEITTTSGHCQYGTSLYIGEHAAQYLAYEMTGDQFGGSATPTLFSCEDTEGLATWTMTMQATSTLSDGTVAHDIPAANVSLIANTNTVSAGVCTAGTNQDAWGEIGTTPGTILNKASQLGDICTIDSTSVNLAVHIDENQAVGIYTGELSLDMPFGME